MEVPELEPGTQRCGRYVMPFHHTPLISLVDPTGFEPVKFCLQSRCHRPLERRARLKIWHGMKDSNPPLRFWRPRHNLYTNSISMAVSMGVEPIQLHRQCGILPINYETIRCPLYSALHLSPRNLYACKFFKERCGTITCAYASIIIDP